MAEQEPAVGVPVAVALDALPPAPGTVVTRGAVLLEVLAPALRQRLDTVEIRVRQLEHQAQDRWSSLRAAPTPASDEVRSRRPERARLQVRAPIDGQVVEHDFSLRSGSTLGPRQLVLRLVSTGAGRTVAHVSERAAKQLRPGDRARFIADAQPRNTVTAWVLSVAPHPAPRLGKAMLARAHGGLIEACGSTGRWTPAEAVHRIALQPEQDPAGPCGLGAAMGCWPWPTARWRSRSGGPWATCRRARLAGEQTPCRSPGDTLPCRDAIQAQRRADRHLRQPSRLDPQACPQKLWTSAVRLAGAPGPGRAGARPARLTGGRMGRARSAGVVRRPRRPGPHIAKP